MISTDKKRYKTSRKQICIVSTVPFVLRWFMAPHIALLCKEYNVTLIASGAEKDLTGILNCHVSFFPLRIERKISIKNDIIALFKLSKLFYNMKFDCVHSIMPKSGLLAMLASRITGVPIRVHTFTGQVWATKSGFKKIIFKLLDKILVMNATHILADGNSQRHFLIDNGIVKDNDIRVLANGSFAGVNMNKFKFSLSMRHEIRKTNSIDDDAIIFLYLGRLNKDKGIVDLLNAFEMAVQHKHNIHLLIVGPDEDDIEINISILAQRFPNRIHRIGFTDHPEYYISTSDVLCLPSYREGFPNVPLQAGAIGLPTIASKIYGMVDAVVDGETGILHTPSSVSEIHEAIILLASNDFLRKKMGDAARERILSKFTETQVTKEFINFYTEIFSKI